MRRYEFHRCPGGYEPWDCTCDPGEGETVTAIDSRDIEPLVRAATKAEAALNGYGCTPLASELREALATFEGEEEER